MFLISENQLRVIVGACILMNEKSDASMEEIKMLAQKKVADFDVDNRGRELLTVFHN